MARFQWEGTTRSGERKRGVMEAESREIVEGRLKSDGLTIGRVSRESQLAQITIGSGDSQLREVITNALNGGKNNILLDMSGVTTIDSSGIGELVGSYTTVTNRGGKLKLLHLPAKLNELLHVTQLITVFEVYENEGEAVKSF